MYKIVSDGIVKLDTGQQIPVDPLNTDYREYLAWISAGGAADDSRAEEIKQACLRELPAQTTEYIYEKYPLHTQINTLAAALQLLAPLLVDKLDATGQAAAHKFLDQYTEILAIRLKAKEVAVAISKGEVADVGSIRDKIRE